MRGWSLMRGYDADPENTAKAIGADGWLRTGDFGVMDARGVPRADAEAAATLYAAYMRAGGDTRTEETDTSGGTLASDEALAALRAKLAGGE